MRVLEVMTRDVHCVHPDNTLREAAEKMNALNVGSLPVCDGDRLLGMLTDRDITVRAVSDGHNPDRDQVREAMTPQVFYCFEDQDITEAAQLMKEKQVRRLPVLNRAKRMVGIVSLGDLAVKAGDGGLSGEALEQVSEPAAPKR